MSEAVIRQRLIRLSCAKLLAFKKSSEGLRRSLHVLTVLKHAHSDEARFEPECSDLLYPQNNRLVVIIETVQPQRLSPLPPSSSAHLEHHVVPTNDSVENDQSIAMETDDEDGTSMARKRKNYPSSIEYGEKRHCDVDPTSLPSSSPTTSSLMSLESTSNN